MQIGYWWWGVASIAAVWLMALASCLSGSICTCCAAWRDGTCCLDCECWDSCCPDGCCNGLEVAPRRHRVASLPAGHGKDHASWLAVRDAHTKQPALGAALCQGEDSQPGLKCSLSASSEKQEAGLLAPRAQFMAVRGEITSAAFLEGQQGIDSGHSAGTCSTQPQTCSLPVVN